MGDGAEAGRAPIVQVADPGARGRPAPATIVSVVWAHAPCGDDHEHV